MYHFLFPTGSTHNEPDETFADQYSAIIRAGFTGSFISDKVLAGVEALRDVPQDSTVVYRGWMTTADEYTTLVRAIDRAGGTPLVSPREYLGSHHLPNWYSLIAEFTPETKIFGADADLVAELHALNWGSYFIKDYVKSLKSRRGSVVHDPSDGPAVVEELREYRGRIEGGICIRRFEDFTADSEVRYFVLRGIAHAPVDGHVPDVVRICADCIPSPFFSVDVARRQDGVLRIVEIGDGQVSDIVGWSATEFASLWLTSSQQR